MHCVMPKHVSRIAIALALAASFASGPSATAAGGAKWYDGGIKESTIINCVSIIQGAPYQENGAGAYVGQLADPDNGQPYVGQGFYIHIVVVGLGNACSGQRFLPGFDLPSGLAPDQTQQIKCYAYGSSTPLTGSDCPQWDHVGTSSYFGSSAFAYYSTDTPNHNLWPLPQGKGWEFQIPVKATKTLSGATLQGYAKIFDGNDSPILTPNWGTYVFAAGGGGGGGGGSTTPSVLYSGRGTIASQYLPYTSNTVQTKYGIASQAEVITQKQKGQVRFQLSRTSTMTGAPIHSLPNTSDQALNAPSIYVSEDWDETEFFDLKKDTTYYWRVGYTPTGGSTTWGATKSFRTLSQRTCNGQPITISLALDQQPTGGSDVILGTSGSDNIIAAKGSDTVCAGGGNDVVSADTAPAYVDGGSGSDTLSYAGVAAGGSGRIIDLGSYTSVENAVGSPNADAITGTDGNNNLFGGGGGDNINAAGGTDLVVPGSGNATVTGGTGTDTLSYAASTTAVQVSLAITAFQAFTGGGGGVTQSAFERLIGGKAGDQLTGTPGNNVLTGGAGKDKLVGGAGTDTCNGGSGTDTATGCEHKTGIP